MLRLFPPQEQVINNGLLDKNEHCFLNMATGSGKTYLAELAIEKIVKSGYKAIYVTPLRALASQQLERWQKRFSQYRIGIFTGETIQKSSTKNEYSKAQILIMTPERLEYSEKDDKFRLFAYGKPRGLTINLGRIRSCARAARRQGRTLEHQRRTGGADLPRPGACRAPDLPRPWRDIPPQEQGRHDRQGEEGRRRGHRRIRDLPRCGGRRPQARLSHLLRETLPQEDGGGGRRAGRGMCLADDRIFQNQEIKNNNAIC